MKLRSTQIGLILLFCLIFIVSMQITVFGATTVTGTITDSSNLSEIKEGFLGTINSNDTVNSIGVGFSTMGNNLKTDYCSKFLTASENDYTGLDYIESVNIKGTYEKQESVRQSDGTYKMEWVTKTYDKTEDITNISTGFLNYVSSEPFTMTFKIKDIEYVIQVYTRNFLADTRNSGFISKAKSESSMDSFKMQGRIAENSEAFIEYLKGNAIEGIIAGSIGFGFNVGVPYSSKQKALADVMELSGGGYDFKNINSVDFTFSYYYSPIFGKMYAIKDPKMPKNREEWIQYGKDHPEFVKNGSIVLEPGFSDFVSTLSEDIINDKGEKITKNVTIEGGAKKFNVSGSKDPKSVISYNMPMAVPYLFQVSNGRGKLMTSALKIIEEYTYSIYNERIYNESNKAVTTMPDMKISRNNLYLYNQEVDVEGENGSTKAKTGIIVVAYFDECVIDTTKPIIDAGNVDTRGQNLYLTGRKIGLSNSYSDALDFDNANVNLMFAVGESGNEAFSPVNVSFPIPGLELKMFNLYDVWSGAAANAAPELTEKVNEVMTPLSDQEIFEYINNRKMHGALPSTVKVVRFFINFGVVYEPENSSTSENENSTSNPENQGKKYAFYIVRNNNYINDANLINWLKTDTARALTYVNADLLLAKITGDFREELGKLTYEDWLDMQKIKNELNNEKEMWLVRAMNIASIVFGVVLIVFAILFMLAYWIDVFNTLTDFSILQFISFGNLYPITDKSTIPYLTETKGQTKFVTFKDVLIIGCIMIGFGIIFMNVTFLFSIIVNLYQYIMYVLGGARS